MTRARRGEKGGRGGERRGRAAGGGGRRVPGRGDGAYKRPRAAAAEVGFGGSGEREWKGFFIGLGF